MLGVTDGVDDVTTDGRGRQSCVAHVGPQRPPAGRTRGRQSTQRRDRRAPRCLVHVPSRPPRADLPRDARRTRPRGPRGRCHPCLVHHTDVARSLPPALGARARPGQARAASLWIRATRIRRAGDRPREDRPRPRPGTRVRRGWGRGYYDRLLAQLRSDAVRVGIGNESRLVPRLPREAHDVRMDFVATETGVRAVVRPDD